MAIITPVAYIEIRDDIIKDLELIRSEKIITYNELAKDIGIRYPTLKRLIDGGGTSLSTLRKLREYVQANKVN